MKQFLVMAGFFLALFLAAGDARAQTGAARGRVVDEKGDPITDATVTIEFQGLKRKFEVKTGKKGEYMQIGLPVGVYRFTATKEGLQGSYSEGKIGLGEATEIPDLVLKKPMAGAEGGPGKSQLLEEFNAGAALLREGKLDESEAAFKALLEKRPGIPEAHYNLGVIQSRRKDFPAAQAEYQQAVDLKPDYIEAWTALARAYEDGGDKAKALETLKEAESQNADSASVHFSFGVYYLKAQQFDEAEAAFKKAQALDPSNVEVLFHLATISLNKGDTAGAVTLLEKYLASSPKNQQNVSTAQGLVAALKKK
jgi:tetratricopeptide (TPR) repeat protein